MGKWGGFVLMAFAVLGCGRVIHDQEPVPVSTGSGGMSSGGMSSGGMSSGGTGGGAVCVDSPPSVGGCGCYCWGGQFYCDPCPPPGAGGSGGSDPGPVVPEGPCTPEATQPLGGDVCNTCRCSIDGTWNCNDVLTACEIGDKCLGESSGTPGSAGSCWCGIGGTFTCSSLGEPFPQSCTEGYVKSAGDGCNTCSCENGAWLCTEKACPAPECPLPDDVTLEPPCDGYQVSYGRAEGTDACCELCYLLPGYTYYDSLEECESSKACGPGETKYADDYCNTCLCTADGEWVCTASDCQAVACGGISGGPCAEDEYCSYDLSMWACDAPDLSGICRPGPTACTEEEAPVCACNGETYSNACIAAMAGWDVMFEGPCDAPSPG